MTVNLLSSAQYSISPFQRVEILIGSATAGQVPNRNTGQFIPEIEGTSIYVESCDYPVLFNINSQGGSLSQSISLRDGTEIDAPFKGITLTHPAITSPAKLVLIVCKHGAKYSNQLATPYTRLNPPFRTISSSGTNIVLGVYVFPGSRLLESLQVSVAATSVTSVTVFPVNSDGIQPPGPTGFNQQVGTTQAVYTTNVNLYYPNEPQITIGGVSIFDFNPIFVPNYAVEFQIQITGTVLSAPNVTGFFG